MEETAAREFFSALEALALSRKTARFSNQKYYELFQQFSGWFSEKNPQVFEEVLNQIAYFGFFKNVFSEYVWCSLPYAKAMGFDYPEELIGKTDFSLPWSFELAEHFDSADEIVLKTAAPLARKEIWAIEGRESEVLPVNRYPIFNQEGALVGLLGLAVPQPLFNKNSSTSKSSQNVLVH